MDRQKQLLWMKDLIEHLGDCYEQWQLADPGTERFLAESMKRDLDECRRLCDSLHGGRPASVAYA
jgi:hypothetical protein